METKLGADCIAFVMGPSYMEDDVRMATDRVGFCPPHLQAMYAAGNRLGQGLMLHTHTRKLTRDAEKIVKSPVGGLFSKEANMLSKLSAHLKAVQNSCYVCGKIDNTFDKYFDTFLHLWAGGGEEARLIRGQQGFCVPHFARLAHAASKLSRGKRDKFSAEILPIFLQSMQELVGDLDWFTCKFDFRFKDEPWKNSKDALPRAIAKLGGSVEE
jgi:hypothetical protein